jgi:Glycosyltransferases involved in cell wall biogenesis
MAKIFIVIPAYNEEKVIGKVVIDIKKEGYKNIIVVDDGSADKTAEVSKKSGAIVLRHILNRGKGAAAKTGLEYAKSQNADIVVTVDGDGQHNPKDIKKMVGKINDGYEVVLGSRFLNRKNKMPIFNRLANFFANVLVFLVYEFWTTDSQSGFSGLIQKKLWI